MLATGQPLTAGMYALLGARLDPVLLHELLVTGARVGGREAARRGIVHEALPEVDVLPRALEIARELAGKDRATMAAIKRGLHRSTLEILAHESARRG